MTDPQTAADAAERVQAYLDARRQIGDTRKTIASAEPDPCAIPARIVRLIEADLVELLAERVRMAAELEQVRGECDASRDAAERANNLLMLLVFREGGSIQLSQADLVRASESLNFWINSRAALLADLARLEANKGVESAASAAPDATGDTQTGEQRADGQRDLTKLEGPQRGSQGDGGV